MKDVTLGQYYPVKSVIHSLDPRIKILSTVLTVVATFVCGTFLGLAVCAMFIFGIALVAHIPIGKMMSGIKGITYLLIFTFLLNAFFYPQGTVIFSLWKITLTVGGVLHALFMSLRLMLLVLGAGLLTYTTSPIELTDGLENIMSPLKKIGFPAHEIAMMMSIALRFIPILSEEADKIMKAQSARGAVFDEGNIVKRALTMVSLLVPLLVSAFRRADELAMAMEARCYHGGDGRTSLKELKMHRRDGVSATAAVLFLAFCIVDGTLLTKLLPFLTA